MDVGVRKLPKKRKFDLSELENTAVCAPVSVVQSIVTTVPQAAAVDYSVRLEESIINKNSAVDLSEWCDHRVLAKQGDWYHPGVIRDANETEVRVHYFFFFNHLLNNKGNIQQNKNY